MKNLFLLSALMLFALGCPKSNSTNPTTPPNSPSSTFTFTPTLTGTPTSTPVPGAIVCNWIGDNGTVKPTPCFSILAAPLNQAETFSFGSPQTLTTVSGSVTWLNIPPGNYWIAGQGPWPVASGFALTMDITWDSDMCTLGDTTITHSQQPL